MEHGNVKDYPLVILIDIVRAICKTNNDDVKKRGKICVIMCYSVCLIKHESDMYRFKKAKK